MNLKDILLKEKDPLKLIYLTLTNKDLEQAFRTMIQAETGIDLVIQLKAEWGTSLISVIAPAWEEKKLSEEDLDILNGHGYSFDFPDEDLNYLLELLFKTEDDSIFLEAQRGTMDDESDFEIHLSIEMEHYDKLVANF